MNLIRKYSTPKTAVCASFSPKQFADSENYRTFAIKYKTILF